jgi:uncharacterized protein YbaP (TraB family)
MRRLCTLAAFTMILAGIAAADQTAPAERHFIWRATGDAGAIVWLVGSMHALPESVFPLPEILDQALDEAELLVLEVDAADLAGAAPAMMAAGSLSSGRRLPDVLSDETLESLNGYLDANGMSLSSFETMRPWMVSLTLTQFQLMRQGFNVQSGLDQIMIRRAAERDLPTMGLETAQQQIELFTTMDDDQADAFLATSIEELKTLETQLDTLTTAWRTGDVETLMELSSEGYEGHPELFRRLVDDRNNAWMPTVRALLDGDRNALVVVGALHLVGETGLVTQLREEGYDIAQH